MSGTAYTEYCSQAMQLTLEYCRKAAVTGSIVLLLGESGSGKDFLARYIHNHSGRSGGPFFGINCANINPELAESELFGHEAGAFTGACSAKNGLIEQANDGTLLLNEIGEISLPVQGKLLTFLDSEEFLRVGGLKSVKTNVRIIAATKRDLTLMVSEGTFRDDLLYRMNVLTIRVPPLRDRKEDLPLLANELILQLSQKMGLEPVPSLEQAALRKLLAYDWPGNVRELRNVLERTLVLRCDKTIRAENIDFEAESGRYVAKSDWEIQSHSDMFAASVDATFEAGNQSDPPPAGSVRLTDQQFTRMIQEVFAGKPTPVSVIAEVLGCSRKTVSERLKRLKCPPGHSGRLRQGEIERIRSELQRWLQENDIQ